MNFIILFILIIPEIIYAQTMIESFPNDSSNKMYPGKYHAIIISVNNYQDDRISDLIEPKNDADRLSELLAKKYFFKSEDIKRLIDPTRNDILDAIEEKRLILSDEDNLIVFFAGHGYWDEELKMGFWLPSDAKKQSKATWVWNNQLTTYLGAFQAKHVLVISDACFSGGIFISRGLTNMDQEVSRLYSLKSRKALTSGNLELVPDESVFMRFFIRELELNQNAFLTSDQLFSKIRPSVEKNSDTQPLYGILKSAGDKGGEFVFYNKTSSIVNISKDDTALLRYLRDPVKRQVLSGISEVNKKLEIPKRIAIISFDNTSGKQSEYGDLGGPLRDMLTTDLQEVQNLKMVDRQSLEKILAEQNLNNSMRFDQSTATKLGKLLGAEIIITGTYFEFYDKLRVDAKFIQVETGEIIYSVGVDGARDKLFELKNSLANKIVETINKK